MLIRFKDILIGAPLPTQQLSHERLDNLRALAAFSPDALSSIAYANQEIYLGLVAAGAAGLAASFPIGLAIAALLGMVALSYLQTIHGYPNGGGSYMVARENLGSRPGLVAAAALLIGYLLTAAVSVTAGVAAIASAFPVLWDHQVSLSLLLLLVITLINLRGAKEAGTLLSFPVYFFLLVFLPMIAYGIIQLLRGGIVPLAASAPPATQALTAFLVLHAFSSGCTALTGIEAISNGVPAFRPPEAQNAGRTLLVMAVLMGLLFLGSIGLTQFLGVVAGPKETILSALARQVLGDGPGHATVQIATMLILAVAANTSFAGYPRLASVLAADGYLPHQLTVLGDRLVYTNGILFLSVGTAVLILVFAGDSHALVPLFAVGVFLAFTLSQAGMVVHWWRERSRGWWLKAGINGLGAVATGVTVIVVGISKFLEGAWITILLVPLLVWAFLRVRGHYDEATTELTLRGLPPSLRATPTPRLVIPVSGVHRGLVSVIAFARSISKDITAVHVELDPGNGQGIRKQWQEWWPDVPLVVVPSPYRSFLGPLLDFLDDTDRAHNDGQLATVILPEIVPAKWWQGLLHNQTAWLLKAALLFRRRRLGFQRVIIDIPFHLER